jgi:hypothetical protein
MRSANRMGRGHRHTWSGFPNAACFVSYPRVSPGTVVDVGEGVTHIIPVV